MRRAKRTEGTVQFGSLRCSFDHEVMVNTFTEEKAGARIYFGLTMPNIDENDTFWEIAVLANSGHIVLLDDQIVWICIFWGCHCVQQDISILKMYRFVKIGWNVTQQWTWQVVGSKRVVFDPIFSRLLKSSPRAPMNSDCQMVLIFSDGSPWATT